ncbi:response regulator transcription factor [Streptomyces sp. NPDC004111]|uniref:helix-turn-helix transcriptional regulator n=1 Tax=Streptomyces sp. NPDC004111 TaxID=3364690 RepID=UPI0036C46AE7
MSSQSGTVDREAAVEACLLRVAGTLLEVAGRTTDPRTAGMLVREAAAVLASVPDTVRPGGRPSLLSSAPAPGALTPRQHAVLRGIQNGRTLRQTADDLYLSRNTVKTHTRALYRKLGVTSRTEAVQHAQALGLISPVRQW